MKANIEIAKRIAKELKGPLIVNLGIGIPTLVAEYIEDESVIFHTENGLLGVTDVEEEIDPNLVNAGKIPVGEIKGAAYFDSAESFGMIRGGHVDIAILGALQVDKTGKIANWAVPGKTILGVGGAMDLLVGSKKIIIAMTHLAKDGSSKIVEHCNYPLTSLRNVDLIVTDLAVFKVTQNELHLIEIMNGSSLEEIKKHTDAPFTVSLINEVVS